MAELATLTLEQFTPLLGETFELVIEGGEPLSLTLAEADRVGDPGAEHRGRQPFALLFRGPLEPVLEQQIYSLHHADLGELGLFLVAVGPDNEGMSFAAVFT